MNENKLFYKGKSFDSPEKLYEYFTEYIFRKANFEDYCHEFDQLRYTIWLNIQVRDFEINNMEIMNMLHDAIYFFIKEINDLKTRKSDEIKGHRKDE